MHYRTTLVIVCNHWIVYLKRQRKKYRWYKKIQLGNYAMYFMMNKFISGDKMRINLSQYSRRDIIECISLLAIDIQEKRAQARKNVY